MRIHNDVAQAIDSRRGVLLVLLTRPHCGIRHHRPHHTAVTINNITTGVPQGSVLGPILVNAYIAPLAKLLHQHNMHHHLYADDTQLYVTFPPTDHMQALARMEACIQEVKTGLCDNGLVMNENKSEAIVIRSPSLRTPITFSRINICDQFVDTSAVIRDLGFAIDTHLSMASQVSNICRSAYNHLARIANYQRWQKSDSRTSNITARLWQCDAIFNNRSPPAPSGNGPAVSGSHCHADSTG